ncbi:MAG TPA: LysR family transcriptional regulator [Sedimenticola sp.]|nr:LysR family transcriptional regulator [Sedimenticola sp.]
MDINGLSAFVTVARSGSFSQAAARLYLTQPAISKRVAALEADLGIRLLDRIGRRVILTGAGQELLPRAEALLLEMADIRRSIGNLSDQVGGTLTMGTSHHIGLRRLPPVLQHYGRVYPAVRLDIRFMDSEAACNAVEKGELELAVVTLPPLPSSNLETRLVWEDPLLFVAGKGHPLAERPRVRLEELAEWPAVLAARGTYTRGIMEQALAPRGVTLTTGMETNYLETLKMLVSIGQGWSLLPETMTREGDLVVLQVEAPVLHRELGLVTHRRRTLSNAARAMIDTCMGNTAENG